MKVLEINLYPIKSCQGISLSKAKYSSEGFLYDREWMFVDSNGQFLTQRQKPSLATIQTKLSNSSLELISSTNDSIHIELDSNGEQKQVTVWGQSVLTKVEEKAQPWIEKNLGPGIMLVRKIGERIKESETKRYIRFADSYPFLFCSLTSLKDLNTKIGAAIPMNRFRANLIFATKNPYEEDSWSHIRIGSHEFLRGKSCTRCIITTIDQSSGEKKGLEPLLTLGKTRKTEKGVEFGQYFQPIASSGEIHIDDKITTLDLQK